jgi:hypothetical protein
MQEDALRRLARKNVKIPEVVKVNNDHILFLFVIINGLRRVLLQNLKQFKKWLSAICFLILL